MPLDHYLYTHLWEHTDGHIASEGTCATSYQAACERLSDYHYSWTAAGYRYYATYIEHQESGRIQKAQLE